MKKRLLIFVIFECMAILSFSQNQVQHKWTLKNLFKSIEKQYGYSFMYLNNEINDQDKISINIEGKNLKDILNEIAIKKNFSFNIVNKKVVLKRNKVKEEQKKPDKEPERIIKSNVISKEDIFAVLNTDILFTPEKREDIDKQPFLQKEEIVQKSEVTVPILNKEEVTTLEKQEQGQKEEQEQTLPSNTTPNYSNDISSREAYKNKILSFSIHNNILYDLILTPNIGIEFLIKEKFSVLVNGAWTHLNWKNEEKTYRTWLISPEIRYYFSENNRFYSGIMFHTGEINLKLAETGSQGDFIGGGITFGYNYNFYKNFYLDFCLGFGYTYYDYETYNFIDGVNIRKDFDSKNLWIPIKTGINFVWKIN